jgi:hypothetical protein
MDDCIHGPENWRPGLSLIPNLSKTSNIFAVAEPITYLRKCTGINLAHLNTFPLGKASEFDYDHARQFRVCNAVPRELGRIPMGQGAQIRSCTQIIQPTLPIG